MYETFSGITGESSGLTSIVVTDVPIVHTHTHTHAHTQRNGGGGRRR